jgi:4-hydroxybenzoyl-CoA reductase subunit beta
MDVLPQFRYLRPRSVDEVLAARLEAPGSRLLGGGTDLLVNLRRGIGDVPSALVDVSGVEEMGAIQLDGEAFEIGAGVTLGRLAGHAQIRGRFPVLAQAAASVAGSTHRNMATVGGNLCLDTRCIFYNQSEWWRASNDYCLKHRGERCHVAPKSKVCYATFSGDLAPALLVLGAEVEVVGRAGRKAMPLSALYTGDGQDYLSLEPEAFVCAVRGRLRAPLRSAYEKMRVRRSIEFPLAGVAAVVGREGDALSELRLAFTGTNPAPHLLAGTGALCGGPLGDDVLERLDALVRRQIMAMRTTFTSGHYRRRVAGVLAKRLVTGLFEE